MWWLTGLAAALEVIVGGFLPIDAVVAAALGVSVGSSILLIFGEPDRRPTAAQVVAALQECGVDVAALQQRDRPGRGRTCSTPHPGRERPGRTRLCSR